MENIVIHPVMPVPRMFRRVQIKSGTLAQIVAVSICDMLSTGTGIRNNDDDVVPGGIMLHTRFGDEILLRTGQTREPVQDRQFFCCCFGGR